MIKRIIQRIIDWATGGRIIYEDSAIYEVYKERIRRLERQLYRKDNKLSNNIMQKIMGLIYPLDKQGFNKFYKDYKYTNIEDLTNSEYSHLEDLIFTITKRVLSGLPDYKIVGELIEYADKMFCGVSSDRGSNGRDNGV